MQLITTQDGSHSLYSEQYGVSYHSKYGAIQETRHVFIEAGLHYKLPVQSELSILEMGFGTGLNALMTLLAAENHAQIFYEAIEAFPLPTEQARLLNFAQLLSHPRAQTFLDQLHRCDWETPQPLTADFTLRKRLETLQNITLDHSFDLVYFDAFAPSAQPELWAPSMLAKVTAAMAPKAIFVTYCAKGAVKRTLKELGLTVESIPGPPGKREMTRAIKP